MTDYDPAAPSGRPPRRTIGSSLYGLAFRLLCALAFPPRSRPPIFPVCHDVPLSPSRP